MTLGVEGQPASGIVVLVKAPLEIGSLADVGLALWIQENVDEKQHKRMAPRARFELAIRRGELTAESSKNLSAVSGVAKKKSGAVLPTLVAPNPAPKT